MKPDSTKHNPNPDYLRDLVERTGLSQRKIAIIIGIDDRLFRMYLANRSAKTAQDAPYPVQFALECLADSYKCRFCGYTGTEWIDDGATCPECKLVQ